MKNTIVKKIKEDRKDFIEVEVGDAKQEEFFPQVKVKRFDNEVNFSMRYKQKKEGIGTYTDDGEKVIWKHGKEEVHIYEVTDGYELEAILDKKPDTNIVEFSIETKGLEFHYQPELTEEEKLAGKDRPEDVVGSYAVYMAEKKKTYENGKSYGCGKVGHIYRPKIIDAEGNWVWGVLRLDEKYGIIRVVIPEEFLDSATYPVRVDPTFGYTSVGSSTLDAGSAINAFCSLLTVTAITGDVLTGYSFYAKKLAANETVAINSYIISGGVPTTKLSGTDQSIDVNSTTAQWWSVGSLSQSMSNGVTYGVAYGGWGGGSGSENTRIYYDHNSGNNVSYNSATSLSATWNHTTYYSDYLSLYATFSRAPINIDYTYTIFIDKANP